MLHGVSEISRWVRQRGDELQMDSSFFELLRLLEAQRGILFGEKVWLPGNRRPAYYDCATVPVLDPHERAIELLFVTSSFSERYAKLEVEIEIVNSNSKMAAFSIRLSPSRPHSDHSILPSLCYLRKALESTRSSSTLLPLL